MIKKTIILVLVVCISAISVCSCHSRADSETLAIGETNGSLDGTAERLASEEASAEYLKNTAYIGLSQIMGASGKKISVMNEFKTLRPSDVSAPNLSDCVFTLMNKQYTGTFLRTAVVNFNTPAYVYKTSDGMQVTIDQNGKIVDMDTAESFTYYVDYPNPDDLLSENEYNDYALGYLNDIYGKETASRYSIYSTTMYTNIIKVYFEANELNDIEYKTNDKIMIRLDINGKLLGYSGNCVGLYINKNVSAILDDDSIIKMTRASLAENNGMIEVHSEKKLVILSDGRMACYANIRFIDSDTSGEWVKVVIPLE